MSWSAGLIADDEEHYTWDCMYSKLTYHRQKKWRIQEGTTKQTHWRNLNVEDCETPPTSGWEFMADLNGEWTPSGLEVIAIIDKSPMPDDAQPEKKRKASGSAAPQTPPKQIEKKLMPSNPNKYKKVSSGSKETSKVPKEPDYPPPGMWKINPPPPPKVVTKGRLVLPPHKQAQAAATETDEASEASEVRDLPPPPPPRDPFPPVPAMPEVAQPIPPPPQQEHMMLGQPAGVQPQQMAWHHGHMMMMQQAQQNLMGAHGGFAGQEPVIVAGGGWAKLPACLTSVRPAQSGAATTLPSAS